MKTRGTVTFVFDDGYTEVFLKVVPLLEKYQLPGVFGIPLDSQALERTEGTLVTPAAVWQRELPARHEIAAHSVHHHNFTTLSAAELERELREPQEQLGATTLIYPGGAYNESVKRAAMKRYRAARSVHKGFEHVPAVDPWALKTYNFTRNNFSAVKANALALWAYLTNGWLIETYHLVTDSPTTMVHAVSRRDFERHLKFVSRLPIAVKTIRAITDL